MSRYQLASFDEKSAATLHRRHNFDAVDVDVRRQVRQGKDRIGDVFLIECFRAFVDFFGFGCVALETHVGKFRFGKSRLDIGNAHVGAAKIGS